jgi:NAD(P)-dependent dehydrogenase (short-subunit alcohol dehydrogenase family)
MNRLSGRVALVTGAAGGIGGATAVMMAAEGARVFVTDIEDGGGEAVRDRIIQAGGEATYAHLDVTVEADWQRVLGQVVETYGGLDILANIAGVCAIAPISQTSYENWRWQIAVDLDGKFFGCKHALPLLAKSGRGAIINIGSTSGLRGTPGLTAYSASKAGVCAFSKALALECGQADNGVRVNTVLPGGIETPIWVKMLSGGVLPSPDVVDHETLLTAVRNGVLGKMAKRIGRPEDIAAAVVYLASDEASFVNGADLIVDSGISVS